MGVVEHDKERALASDCIEQMSCSPEDLGALHPRLFPRADACEVLCDELPIRHASGAADDSAIQIARPDRFPDDSRER